MLKIIPALIISFFCSQSYSQVQKSKHIFSDLDTISINKDKIKYCMSQGDTYMYTNIDSFEFWYNKGIELAKDTKEAYYIPKMYAYIGFEYSNKANYSKQAELIHEGKKYVTPETPARYKTVLLTAEAQYYTNVNQFGPAKKLYNEVIELAKNENDSVNLSAALHNLGIVYYHQNELVRADSIIHEALVINKIIGQQMYEMNNISMLANIQKQLKNYAKSLAYNLEAKQYYDEQKDLSAMTFIRANIADDYWKLGKKKLAFSYVNKSIEMSKENEFKEWEWNNYSRLSGFYEDEKNYKKALDYYKLFAETKFNSINEESALKLESLTHELENSELEVSKKNEALQKEKIILQEERIKLQTAENYKNKLQVYFLIGGLLITAFFGFFMYNRLRITNRQNRIIEEQRLLVEKSNEEISEKNRDITASITYAKRIQNAILPTSQILSKILKNHFVFYKPKDLVSGDFYWAETSGNHTFIAVADCTGHGVPGALVSVVCHNALNRAVNEYNLLKPDEILNKTRDIVIEQFDNADEHVTDGMDITFCAINNEKNEFYFSGANNPLWIIRNKELLVFKGDKQPIGSHQNMHPFSSQKVDIQPKDKIYLFSDGIVDQFGGVKGKKFKTAGLTELLLSISEIPITEQGVSLNSSFDSWKGDLEQLDDVCILGFEV